MAYKKWLISEIDKSAASNLANECDIDPLVALIAQSRGYTDPYELEEFLSDDPIFSEYEELPDILIAADIINAAIESGEFICVYGDYDCDGVSATALLYEYLTERGAKCTYYIPDRFNEGYGMSIAAIDALKERGVDLIITVDNGISCAEQISYANSLGIKTVVTDHHLPPETLPDAAALVNPHLRDCGVAFPDICGVFVAFKLVCALEKKEPEELINKYGELVTLGTLADVMPLKNENRDAVKCGLKLINSSKKAGIVALINSASLKKGELTAGKVAFGLTPRINAAGRMGSAETALKLLIETDFMKASELAAELEKMNALRQKTEQDILKSAVSIIEDEKLYLDRVIVVCGENWHKGVVGIAAARLVEKYGKPAIVLSEDGSGEASGSGRSIEGFSLYDAVKNCSDILTRFGGHENAAGLRLKAENIGEFRRIINAYAADFPPIIPTLKIDCKLNSAGLSLDLADAVKTLEPFGMGNPTPVFALCNMTLERIIPLSNNKHTKLLLTKGGRGAEVVVFGVNPAAVPFSIGDTIDTAVTVDINEYMGKRNLSVVVKDWRQSNINEDAFFADIALYSDFARNESKRYPDISREEIGIVYKSVSGNTSEALRQKFIKSLGLFKTNIALDVLTELGLLREFEEDGVKKLRTVAGKTAELSDSEILKRLRRE